MGTVTEVVRRLTEGRVVVGKATIVVETIIGMLAAVDLMVVTRMGLELEADNAGGNQFIS